MDVHTRRSNIHGASHHFVHSLPSSPPHRKEGLAHTQKRPQHSRLSSCNAERFSQSPTSHRFHGVDGLTAYPPSDPSNFSNRHSMGHQIGPNAFRRSYSDNRASWLPSQFSSQTSIIKDQMRATPNSHVNLVNGKSATNSNRTSRLPDMPKRPGVEPANLIHSIRDPSLSNRPKSVQVDSRRVVIGILQSALPPSARPVPLETAPPRSMPIIELEKRHKAALQKLQTLTNHRAAKNLTSSQSKHAPPQQRPTIQVQYELSSNASSKAEKADIAERTIGKSSSVSSRRSFFGFLNLKEELKPSKLAGEPVKLPKRSPKKKLQESPRPLSSMSEDGDEDEDVPLAQLRDRRASYNPTSQIKDIGRSGNLKPLSNNVLTKSFSAPTNVNKLGDGEKLHMNYDAVDDTRHANLIPGFHPPPTWLHAHLNLSEEKHGPRPLIFEDEAKAIRNSKRLWVQ